MATSSCGLWRTIEPDEEDIAAENFTTHVIPTFGRDHELWDFCWCEPEQDEDCPDVLVHHQDH